MRRLIGALLLCAAGVAWSAPTVDELAAHLVQRPVLRAEFAQEKRMAAFKKPLVTRGRLILVRGRGVLWKIEAPLRLTYVLTDDRIVEITEDGSAQTRSAQEVPGLAQVGRVFRALIGAQTSALQDIFALTPEGSLDSWRLLLTPKPGPVGQYMRRIQLAGSRYVERIRIEETNGDTTVISFRNTSVDGEPSAEERASFGER